MGYLGRVPYSTCSHRCGQDVGKATREGSEQAPRACDNWEPTPTTTGLKKGEEGSREKDRVKGGEETEGEARGRNGRKGGKWRGGDNCQNPRTELGRKGCVARAL